MSIACSLAFSLTPDFGGVAYAAEPDSKQSQETTETVKADSKPAQEYTLESVTVEAKRPDWESKLSPGTVTIIRPDDYKGEQKTLPELLKDVPGVHVRYVSGKGQYTTVSVRGSTAAQVGVFVDGVLSNLGGDAAVDISTIPIHNVERIEVYRGYIPARFGGTYMGGVINIVTKKPDKANISAQVGKSSWGGTIAGLEITQPLGSGSLMIGINRDESDGDFRYENPYSKEVYARDMPGLQANMNFFIRTVNDNLDLYTGINPGYSTLEEVDAAFNNPAVYNQYLSAIRGNWYWLNWHSSKQEMLDDYILNNRASTLAEAEQLYNQEAKAQLDDVRTSLHNQSAGTRKLMSELSNDNTRWRKNNDYKNTDAIIKWQDDHWLVKGSWKKIDRGMPRRVDGDPTLSTIVDLPDKFERKRQELTTKELMVGRRDMSGNLEWGWQLNYLDQDKRYRNPDYQKFGKIPAVFEEWSAFDSRRLGGAIDGTYKAGDNHLLEFLANWSKEKMDVNGSRMDKYDFEPSLTNRERFRTYYEHTLFNLQLQDTITLNQAADLWLTPSIRYNYSKVMGRALGKSDLNKWVDQEDSQVNDKVTWQVALKKQVDEHLTLRSTYGTYYRLLNLYEIAGDGAGILPRPNAYNDPKYAGQSIFPVPEEGTQWDLAAIWDGRLLGANSSKVQLTYFGRDSKNMLHLYRFGYNFWSYTNARKGQANGVELQADFNWDKWDMSLAGTYLHTKQQTKYNAPSSSTGEIYFSYPQLYTPEWEGSARLTYRPDNRLAVFGEVKYIDEMVTGIGAYDKPYGQTSLTTVGLGAKYKIDKDCQIIAGVNDLFDKGPEMTFNSGNNYSGSWQAQNMLLEYPLQGRTYYVTLQYKY
ncbi:TonB-dependent receptor [Sporomusa rhizae]|uniref:TonB-dependent receptor n=1 Tax=Sporomusa rhizae TaxID=357999 RepID=UPI003529EC9C